MLRGESSLELGSCTSCSISPPIRADAWLPPFSGRSHAGLSMDYRGRIRLPTLSRRWCEACGGHCDPWVDRDYSTRCTRQLPDMAFTAGEPGEGGLGRVRRHFTGSAVFG